jgi:hypothetical protein
MYFYHIFSEILPVGGQVSAFVLVAEKILPRTCPSARLEQYNSNLPAAGTETL